MNATAPRTGKIEKPARGPFRELDGIARALKVEYAGAPELTARVKGTPVRVSLVSRGEHGLLARAPKVVALELELGLESPTGAPPSLALDLRRETPLDRSAKDRGLARELQLGDRGFDDAVYIGGTVPDAEARRLLERARTRGAVMALLEGGCLRVRLTGDAVTAKWLCQGGAVDTDAVLAGLEQCLDIARGGGPRGQPAPQRGEWVPGLAMFVFLASVGYAWFIFSDTSPVPWLPVLGATVGALAGLALRGPIASQVRGDAESRPRYAFASLLATVGLGLFGAVFATHLNAALDDRPASRLRGRVVSVTRVNDSDVLVGVSWVDGTVSKHFVHDPEIGSRWTSVTQGNPASVVRHRGAFGAEWEEPLDLRRSTP